MLSKHFLRFEGSISQALQVGWAWVPTASPCTSRLLKEWRRSHGFNATGTCSIPWIELYLATMRSVNFFAQGQPLNFISLQSLLTPTEVRAVTCPQRHPNPDSGKQQFLQHSSLWASGRAMAAGSVIPIGRGQSRSNTLPAFASLKLFIENLWEHCSCGDTGSLVTGGTQGNTVNSCHAMPFTIFCMAAAWTE